MPRRPWCSLAEAGTHTFVQYSSAAAMFDDARQTRRMRSCLLKDFPRIVLCGRRLKLRTGWFTSSVSGLWKTPFNAALSNARVSLMETRLPSPCAPQAHPVLRSSAYTFILCGMNAAPKQELKDVIGSMIPTSVPTSFKVKPETK